MCCDPNKDFSAWLMSPNQTCVLSLQVQVCVWDTELLLIIPFAVTGLPESIPHTLGMVKRNEGGQNLLDGIFLFHGPVGVHLERQRSLVRFVLIWDDGCAV